MLAAFCPDCGAPCSGSDPRCPSCETLLLATGLDGPEDGRPTLSGIRISHFHILEPLGRGGMGIVYKALDVELGREVALKLLDPGREHQPADEIRFRREAQSAAALDHPNIGAIYEIGEHKGRRFLAMPLYPGETLARRLSRQPGGRLPLAEAAAIAGQLASALSAAHAAGIVHRDLKPDNVMVMPDGRVKLLDFGLARREDSPSCTEQGTVVGTAAYMSPERLRGEGSGPAADLWALGTVLYEMLTGQRPFGGERKGMVHAILYEDPPAPRELRPDVPPTLERIIQRCLAKDPAKRLSTASTVTTELITAGLYPSASESFPPPPRRKSPWWIWTAAPLVLLPLTLGGLLVYHRAPPPLAVALLPGEVKGNLPPDDQARLAANLQLAGQRALSALDGIVLRDAAHLQGLSGSPAEKARALGVQETVTFQADCPGDLCRVTIQRLNGQDGSVLWTEEVRISLTAAKLSAEAITSNLRKGFPGRKLRTASLDLQARDEDYERYLGILQRISTRQASLDALLQELGDLRRQAPSFIDAYFLESSLARHLYVTSGNPRYLDRGLEVARLARALAPDDPRPVASLFDTLLEAGRLAQAESLLKDLEASSTNVADTLLRRARLAERRGDAAGAIARMTELAGQQPSWQYLLILSNMEYRQGRIHGAREHLRQLLDRAPGNVQGLELLAQLELLQGDPERAVSLFVERAEKAPSVNAYSNLGAALLLTRRYSEAEAAFRQALSLAPGSPMVELNLADCLSLLGRREAAVALYRRVAESAGGRTTPAQWQILSVQAQALAHLGEARQAVAALQQALQQTPDNPQLAYEASLVYTLVQDRTSALLYAEKAMQQGLEAAWFRFPWFDPLRSDSEFLRLTASGKGSQGVGGI